MKKGRSLGASLAMLALLSIGVAHAAAPVFPTEPSNVWSQVALESDYFESEVFPGNVTAVAYSVASNVTVATMVMDSAQFNAFNSSTGAVRWLYGQNGTDTQGAVSLHGGATSYLVIWAWGASAEVNYTSQTYLFGDLEGAQPTGVAAYGLYNDSGALSAYTVSATEVVGSAAIDSLRAYNASAPEVNASIYGASLQLNSILAVTDKDGLVESYWCQDVPTFVTNSSLVEYVSNVWNNTVPQGPLTNQTITSPEGGYVSASTAQGNVSEFYANSSPYFYDYRLPLDLAIIMNDTVVPGTGVEVGFGVQVLQNGSRGASPVYWFDTAVIHDPNAVDASFYISGDEAPGSGNYYDAELVFGGESSGEATSFQAMNATLGLFYGDGGPLTSFPSLYSVGGDTVEAADNLHVSLSQGGAAQVSVGTPDYVFLGNSSGTFQVPGFATTAEFPAAALGPFLLATFMAVAVVGTLMERRRVRV